MSSKIVVSRGGALAKRSKLLGDVVGAFESETAAVFLRTAPSHEHIILYSLISILLIFFLLSAVVKLDKVITGIGRIVPTSGELYISPYDTGIVKKVNVKVGDVVKKGDALATLDPTFTSADLKQLELKLASDEAAVTREEAELANKPYIVSDVGASRILQRSIYLKRQAEYKANLGNFDAQIRSAEAQINEYRADTQGYAKRLKLADDVQKTYQPLMEKGYVSKLQVMQAADTHTEMSRLLGDAQNQMDALSQTLLSLKAQRDVYIQKWQSDTGTQLVLDRNDLDQTRQLYEKAKKMSDLVSLQAPADAIVLKIGKASIGSIAGGGGQDTIMASAEPLFTLVPVNASLEADVNVNSEDLGFIKVGDPAQLKLDAYRFMRHGTAKGTVKTISEGSFTTDINNAPVAPYFRVRVSIKDVHLHDVPSDFRLVPGMTLAADIMVGRRTILSYLVEGALRTGSEAMREP